MNTTLDAAPTQTTVTKLARKWAERFPGAAPRIERAIALVANVKPGKFPNIFFIEGATGNYIIRVNRTLKEATCTCPDHAEGGNKCKHIHAVALYEKGLEIEAHEAGCKPE